MKKVILMLVGFALVAGCAGTNPQVDSQVKSSMEYFSSVPFTALVNFHVHGNHYVDSNGKPIPGKDQSKRKGKKGLLTRDFAVAQGQKGYIFYLGTKGDRIIAISVSDKTGLSAAWNPSNVEISFSRPITKQDVTPENIARALSSLMIIEGLEPGSELDDLLDKLD